MLSHHHPDHTINIGLFPDVLVHDFQATYVDDQWLDHDLDHQLSPHVRLLATPGHTREDLTTLVETEAGLIAFTHLWWNAQGPSEDPFAPDPRQLTQSRRTIVAMRPTLIVPGHGEPFVPDAETPI